MKKAILGSGLVVLGLGLSSARVGAAIFYEPFDYTAGDTLVGETNVGKVWTDPGSPAQPLGAGDTQRIVAGSLGYAGLQTSAGNSFSLPKTPGGNLARIELPDPNGYTYDSATSTGNAPGGLFMGFVVKVAEDTTFTSSDYFAGFHLGTGTAGMSVANGYAGMIYLRPDPNNAKNYNFGVAKNNTAGSVIGWSTQSIAPGETAFLVFQYQFATAATNNDDTVNLWVDPDLSVAPGTPSATTSTGADGFATSGTPPVTTSILRSVYFRSNSSPATPSDLQIDELRVGLAFDDVAPGVPEPASLALVGLGGLALVRRRR